MKKSILIGALVVLLLAGFTACSNNTPTSPIMGSQIEGVELVSAPDYLIGLDKIDPSKVQLNAIKNDGSKVPYTGTELGLEAKEITKASNVCKVQYGDLTFYVTIPGYEWDITDITEVNVNGAETKTLKLTDTALSIKGVKATIAYEKGTRSVELSEVIKSLGITPYDKIQFGTTDTPVTAEELAKELKIDLEKNPVVDVIEVLTEEWKGGQYEYLLEMVTGSWEVKIVKEVRTVESVSLQQIYSKDDTTYEVFIAGSTKNTLNKIAFTGSIKLSDKDDAIDFEYLAAENSTDGVYLTDANTVAGTYTFKSGVTIILQDCVSTVKFTEVGTKNYSVIVAYTDESGTVKSNPTTLKVTVIKDYPTTFDAVKVDPESKKHTTDNDVWKWNETISLGDFILGTVPSTGWASGETGYNDTDKKAPELDNKWSVNPGTVEMYAPTTGYKVTFTYSGYQGIADPDKTIDLTYEMKTVDPKADNT